MKTTPVLPLEGDQITFYRFWSCHMGPNDRATISVGQDSILYLMPAEEFGRWQGGLPATIQRSELPCARNYWSTTFFDKWYYVVFVPGKKQESLDVSFELEPEFFLERLPNYTDWQPNDEPPPFEPFLNEHPGRGGCDITGANATLRGVPSPDQLL